MPLPNALGHVAPLPSRRKLEWLQLGIGILIAEATGVMVWLVLPGFKDVLKSFGAELPLVTRLLFNYDAVLFALPVVALVFWFAWPNREQRGLASLLSAAGIAIIAPVLSAVAVYLPILRLAAPV